MTRSFDPIQLGSIEIFCKAAELGGFTPAAEALGLTPPAVSRSVQRLEARLGVRLFARTTRRVRLTDDGRLYYEQCRQALAQIEEAQRALSGQRGEVRGTLRVSVPSTYGHHRLLPRLPLFLQRHPEVSVDVQIANRNVDFIEEGYDVAIRRGEPQDTRLVARLLEHATLGVFASPDYLRRHGTPGTLDDLDRHLCIQFVLPSTGRALPWYFRDGGQDVERRVASRLCCLEDVVGCLNLARSGGGLAQGYHFVAATDLARGALLEVLQGHGGRSWPFYALYPQHRHLSARVRAFVDFLLEDVAAAGRR
ncbi:LysR family transcriptional regulator [Schlegelella sp. S2-27]|uniref:LysR family transcriptional regulator n=1 Tax=Caldimonas mangrovi TaxID=2944811 RepID=A0ABT0YIQ8_9BURK|nr:LysR family transcriptional regulator [Caldimonas mangrovi]MCM5678107.1 LysR family transcriptional regulator [Caldimonas mangrovi]